MKNPLIKLLNGLYVVLIVVSCSSQNENKDQPNSAGVPYTIDLTKFIEKPGGLAGISDIADSITYVVFKPGNDGPMGNIGQIVLSSEYIIVSDNKSIFIFNRSGEIIKKINHYGRGPGEYLYPQFTFNDDNKEIAIWTMGKILFYDINDNLLRTLGIEGRIDFIKWLDKDMYLIKRGGLDMAEDSPDISTYVINSKGELLASHKYRSLIEKPPLGVEVGLPGSNLSNIDAGILFSEPFDDTLYLVDRDGIRSPFIVYDFGPHKMPNDYYNGPRNINRGADMKYILNLKIFFSPNYCVLCIYLQGSSLYGVWDFKKGKAMTFQSVEGIPGIEDDIDGGLPFSFLGDNPKGFLLSTMNNVYFLENKSSFKVREGSELEKITKNMTVYDDPILRIVHLKKKIK